MAIASPSAPAFSPSFCCARTDRTPRFTRFSSISFVHSQRTQSLAQPLTRRLVVSSRLSSPKSSAAGGVIWPENGDTEYELQHSFSPQQQRRGSPVFVALPVDAVGSEGEVRRLKAMTQSFRALAAAGVEGVVMEVWWGLVERYEPRVYNWGGYLEIVGLARRCGLKVRAVMAFHQCGTGRDDPHWIPLPLWVLEEINKDPDLAYSDRFGRRNIECISLGCDTLPVLRGRSPIQTYSDFMRDFRDTFRPYLGVIVTRIQVGTGPTGELRYPSWPSQKLTSAGRSHELGEFQCYDKYMLASLNACARETGMREWGKEGPINAGSLMRNPEQTKFSRSFDGAWNTPYDKFFLKWYSEMLLLHGERICKEAESIFRGTEVNTSVKVARTSWHYTTRSDASELTAGYYNISTTDGYLPVARMIGKYGFTICCSCFGMQDLYEKQKNPVSSPEAIRQLLKAARVCDIPVEGENSTVNFDDESFQQVLKMSKLYSTGLEKPSFSFNFMRMGKSMFEIHNWVRFTRFVRQMADANAFRAKLGSGGDTRLSSAVGLDKFRVALASH